MNMKKFIDWIMGFFRQEAQDGNRQRKAPVQREKQHFGAHYYLGDLLDALDRVFEDLPVFKKSDRDAYDLFSKLGASVISSDGMLDVDIDAYAVRQLPGFGCFYIHTGTETEERVPARFVYFFKEDRPVNVQTSNHTIYRCGVTYHSKKWNRAACAQFYIALSDDGTITPLKSCTPRKHAPGFVRMEWDYPRELLDISTDNGTTPQERAKVLFSVAVNASLARERGITVRVKKGGQSAAFAIDMTRSPYFFSDREKVTDANGQTKKIFHIVKGHWRTLGGGHQKFIKTHFRGLKNFMWNGYEVSIGVGGKHGLAVSDYNLKSLNEIDARDLGDEAVGTDYLAAKLDRHTL